MFKIKSYAKLNLAFDFMNDTNISGGESEGGTNFFDLSSDSPPPLEKKFSGLAATPSQNVFVDTIGTGIDIDLIEASDALRTWAAYA